jgi:hypothetical protein
MEMRNLASGYCPGRILGSDVIRISGTWMLYCSRIVFFMRNHDAVV